MHGRLGEGFSAAGRGCRDGEVGTVGPAADGEEGFEMAVPFFEEVKLFGAAVGV